MKVRIILILSCSLAAGALAACGGDDDAGEGSAEERPTVIATTGVLAEIAEPVAGEDAEVVQLIPDGSSPHDFALSTMDRQELEQADLVLAVGSGLEPSVPLDEIDSPRWLLTEQAGELLSAAEEEHEGEREEEEHEEHQGEEEHEHGSEDPHVWMDPTRVAAALPSLARALADADPEHADDYRRRAREYSGRLRALDREIRGTLSTIPDSARELVTSHDALGYLADRYELEVIATPFPSSGPEAEVSAERLREVEDAVREARVPAVFAQAEDDPEVMEQVASDTGVEVVTGLLVESPGSGSYEEMLRRDARLLARALGN